MQNIPAAALAALLAVTAPPPALAGAADSGIVQIEVLDGGMTARGTYLGALRIKLQPGWKTYWRAPGDAGIPPSFTWRGARNVGGLSITWPAPEVFQTSGFRTIGYHGQLVLPVEITPEKPGKPVRLKGRMQLGVCKDVCVPAELSFDHQLDSGAGRNPAIAAALASRPWSANEAGVRRAACSLRPSEYGMKVTARISMPSAGGDEVAVIESGNPKLYAGETRTRREGGLLVAETEFLPADGNAYAIDRSQLRITVLGQNHAVDIQGCSAG
ncbi:protein-disulfide reductase DsbD domain-containing protein [Leisingera sp. F5]|uniref:protein-disulfide reductase DsbD domain-containing protein n=1 Tax=Leisingera sp. F5 TaxID=1813816 RepID=UPI0025C1121A|nr:protein-disulfide reductase DsbD domain-containing protein [Leisingera sp. F5]